MIAREEARLRSLFQRLIVLSLTAAPAACSTSNGDVADASVPEDTGSQVTPDANGNTGDGSPFDATLAEGGGGVDGGGVDSSLTDSGTSVFADDGPCAPQFLDGADDGNGCQYFTRLGCGFPEYGLVELCYLSLGECATVCGTVLGHTCAITECLNEDAGDEASVPPGPVTIECATGAFGCGPGVGRRPEGLADARPARGGDAAGRWLAETARLEAASVHAFRRLGTELSALRAPRALVRAAERSARDEIRHARVTTRLARRRGAAPARVSIEAVPAARSLAAFAVENAVEGCVRESFGALVATRQAARAADPEIAREMARIARDETRHAALAWEIARWLTPRLAPAERARVKQAMKDALASLRCEMARTDVAVASELGLPSGAEAVELVDAFAATVMSPVAAA